MDMNLFKSYLTDINNNLSAPQKGLSPIYEGHSKDKKMYEYGGKKKMYEYGGKKKKMMQQEEITAEDVVNEYLQSYFGGELTEGISEDAIIEAVQSLNIITGELTEYFLSEDEDIEPSEIVVEAISDIFGDELNEDTADDEIISVLENLNAVTEIVNEYFTQD